jgi:flagellar biosynthesis anti-sigma factor FlgM
MRIDSNTLAAIGSLQDNSPAQRSGAAHVSREESDGVTARLSGDSKVLSSVGSTEDVRQERVAALKQALESGDYEINAAGIASAMMESMLNSRYTL